MNPNLPPLSDKLVDTVIASMRALDGIPRDNPDHPEWTALDSVIKVHLEMWSHPAGGGQ